METVGTPALWAGFTLFVLAMLAIDLGVFHRKAHEVSLREALGWSVVWVALALTFGAGVFYAFGPQTGVEFLTGYLIEKALAVDNIFVFVAIFASFGVPAAYQHRVLFWGVLGALVLRAVFILLGAALLTRFHWILYVFGGFLLVTGVKLLLFRESEVHPEKNWFFRKFRQVVPAVSEYHGSRFIIRKEKRLYATPLLLVLAGIEISDVIFAVDSIPAIFAVTRDPFIVYTSNVFAILGLRSMYFLLASGINRFVYLKPGLALVLVFVGAKMLLSDLIAVPVAHSLAVVAGLLAASVALSLSRAAREERNDLSKSSRGSEI